MKPIRFTFLLFALLCVHNLMRAQGKPDPGTAYVPSGYSLVFSDEFNSTSLDTKKWNTLAPFGVQYYSDSKQKQAFVPRCVTLDTGILTFTGKPYDGQGGNNGQPYISGSVTTNQTFVHGYFEARCWMPNLSKGAWPAFWLTSSSDWPPEWDIFEVVSSKPSCVYEYRHLHSGTPNSVIQGVTNAEYYGVNVTDGYHIFGFQWTSTELAWFVDGKLTQKVSVGGESDETMWLNLSQQIGGDWPGDPDGSTKFPMRMYVDYVRIYQSGINRDSTVCQSGIKVDGVLSEGAWTGAGKQIAKVVSGTADGVTAEFKTCFDNNYLYVGADVKDSKLYNQAANIWENSSVEVFLDMNHGRTTTYESNDFQYITVWNSTQPYEKNGRTTGVITASANTSSGYSVEMAIPWSTLGVTPAQGALYGFDAGVNINHDNGARTGHLMWNGTETNSTNTSQFGDLVLNNACAATLAPELNSDETIRIYPNPLGSGNLTIDLPGYANATVTLTDISGRIIYSDKLTTNSSGRATLPAGTLAGNGLYFLSVKTADAMKNFKLTIDK